MFIKYLPELSKIIFMLSNNQNTVIFHLQNHMLHTKLCLNNISKNVVTTDPNCQSYKSVFQTKCFYG